MRFNDRGIRIVLACVLVAVAFAVLIAAAPGARALDGASVSAPTLAQPHAASASVVPSWSPLQSPFSAPAAGRASGTRPVITRLSLSAAKPGVRLTISGRGFGARRGKGCVLFGAVKSTSWPPPGYVRWSATKITCTVPVVGAGKLLVKVRTAKGTSRGRLFTVRMPAGALTQLDTAEWDMMPSYWYGLYAPSDRLGYYTDSAGDLGIVSADFAHKALKIDTFDPLTLQRIGRRKSISYAGWPQWGGFYAGPDGCLYVLVGRDNPKQDDAFDVVAVRRYDRTWTLLGTAYLKGGASQKAEGILSPFEMPAHMVLAGNRLVVHMSRFMYAMEGLSAQTNLTFEVDVDTMTATTFQQLGGYAYCSVSLQQRVAMNGTSLVMIDHGNAYPRAIQMGVMANYPDSRDVSTYDLMEFNGAIGASFTGATVTGLVSGPSGIVVVGSSIQQPDAPNGQLGSRDEHPNIYAIWADPATGAHAVHWLTDFAPHGADWASYPRVVQVGADRYAVLFSVRNNSSGQRMEYRLIDSAGAVLASTSFPGVFFCAISDPILVGGRVYWVGFEPNVWGYDVPRYLFGIDVSDPATPALLNGAAP